MIQVSGRITQTLMINKLLKFYNYKSRARCSSYFYVLDTTLNCLIFMLEKANILCCRNSNGKGEIPMEFLEEILGTDLYNQVKTKVSSYNEKADKDKRVSIANVNGDEYVTKAKYSQLETDLNNTKTSLSTAQTTIEDLKKSNGDNADLQTKITNYETQIANLETKSKEDKAKLVKEIAIKDALYNEKAKHPELLLSKFDLSKIVLDENGEKVVSGIEDQMKSNKETYKDLFGEVEPTKTPYHYTPQGGNQNPSGGATDFVGIIKENQARKI